MEIFFRFGSSFAKVMSWAKTEAEMTNKARMFFTFLTLKGAKYNFIANKKPRKAKWPRGGNLLFGVLIFKGGAAGDLRDLFISIKDLPDLTNPLVATIVARSDLHSLKQITETVIAQDFHRVTARVES